METKASTNVSRVRIFPPVSIVLEKISLGETMGLGIFSKAEEYLIAKGSSSISFLVVSLYQYV